MDILYNKYENIIICLTKYRKYTPKNPKITFDNFKSLMKNTHYIKETYLDGTREVDVYLFNPNKDYTPTQFRKILEKYKRKKKHILFFTKRPFNTYIKKSIKEYSNITFNNYLHKHFIIEINRGPLCSKHEILTKNEAEKLSVLFKSPLSNLPNIYINDPHIIWIGGELYDIIRITSYSELTGISIRYRIITPITGKVQEKIIEERDIDFMDDTSEADVIIDEFVDDVLGNKKADKSKSIDEDDVDEADNNNEDYTDDYE